MILKLSYPNLDVHTFVFYEVLAKKSDFIPGLASNRPLLPQESSQYRIILQEDPPTLCLYDSKSHFTTFWTIFFSLFYVSAQNSLIAIQNWL